MSSLDWSLLVNYFMRFRGEADKVGFYTEELNKMEQSLLEMCPIKGLEFKDVMDRGDDRDARI
jgi:hypothetical protein